MPTYGTQYLFGVPLGYEEGANPSIRYPLTVDYASASGYNVRTVDGGTLTLAASPAAPTLNALLTVSLANAAGLEWRVIRLGGVRLTQAKLANGYWALIVVASADTTPANYRTATVDGGTFTTAYAGVGDYRVLLLDAAASFSGTPLVKRLFGGLVALGSALLGGGVSAPGAPTITAPSADATASSLTPTISWNRSADDPADGSVVYTVTLTLNAANIALTSASNLNATSYVINPTVLAYLAISDNAYTVTVTPSRSGVAGTAATRNFYVTPATLSNLIAWLSSDMSLYQDTGTSTPATVDGDPVGRWTNRAGTPHATQATGTAKPTLKTNILNGQPVLRFDGGDSLDFGSQTPLNLPLTMVVVVKINGTTNTRLILTRQAGAANGAVLFRANTTNIEFIIVDAAAAYATATVANDNAFHAFFGQAVNGETAFFGMDTTALSATADTITSFSNAAMNVGIGTNGTGGPPDGDYALILTYNRKLTATELASIGAYITSKYGISVSN